MFGPMKSLLLLLTVILFAFGCAESAEEDNDSNPQTVTEEASGQGGDDNTRKGELMHKVLQTASGTAFTLVEKPKAGASLSTVMVLTDNFTEINNVFRLGTIDPVEDFFLADVDDNGFEEVYVVTRSAGSGSYSNIYGFSSNQTKSASQIYIPEPTEADLAQGGLFEGFRGHNKFAMKAGKLTNTFPRYRKGDSNAKPTGGETTVTYRLEAGEASWRLVAGR